MNGSEERLPSNSTTTTSAEHAVPMAADSSAPVTSMYDDIIRKRLGPGVSRITFQQDEEGRWQEKSYLRPCSDTCSPDPNIPQAEAALAAGGSILSRPSDHTTQASLIGLDGTSETFELGDEAALTSHRSSQGESLAEAVFRRLALQGSSPTQQEPDLPASSEADEDTGEMSLEDIIAVSKQLYGPATAPIHDDLPVITPLDPTIDGDETVAWVVGGPTEEDVMDGHGAKSLPAPLERRLKFSTHDSVHVNPEVEGCSTSSDQNSKSWAENWNAGRVTAWPSVPPNSFSTTTLSSLEQIRYTPDYDRVLEVFLSVGTTENDLIDDYTAHRCRTSDRSISAFGFQRYVARRHRAMRPQRPSGINGPLAKHRPSEYSLAPSDRPAYLLPSRRTGHSHNPKKAFTQSASGFSTSEDETLDVESGAPNNDPCGGSGSLDKMCLK